MTSKKAYVVTGPTNGAGRAAALMLARYGTVILVGRDAAKLADVRDIIEHNKRRRAICVVCDLSEIASARRAAAEITALQLPIAGLLNNAGVQNPSVTKTAAGLDMTFVTNHLGPFALTEALVPHLQDGAKILFVASATEDPERQPAKGAGFRGGRYISAEASARGEWVPGGSARPGFDAYATSKQCNIVTAMALARENPRLHFNAVEPGVMFNTGLHGSGGLGLTLMRLIVPVLAPFVKFLSTPRRAARVFTKILTDKSGQTGVYYDEAGHPMQGSPLVRDPAFAARVVAETRAWLVARPD